MLPIGSFQEDMKKIAGEITERDIAKFSRKVVARIEFTLDIADYIPNWGFHVVSGVTRSLLGVAQIMTSLWWYVFHPLGYEATKSCAQASLTAKKLAIHGVANLLRGIYVLTSASHLESLILLVTDIVIPKLFVYKTSNTLVVGDKHSPRLVSMIPAINKFQKEFIKRVRGIFLRNFNFDIENKGLDLRVYCSFPLKGKIETAAEAAAEALIESNLVSREKLRGFAELIKDINDKFRTFFLNVKDSMS